MIERGPSTFVEVGQALRRIRDERLYRPRETFAEYCKERWGMTIRYAEYQMSASAIVGHLETNNCSHLPGTESQCRPLTKLHKSGPDGKRRVIDLEKDRNQNPMFAKINLHRRHLNTAQKGMVAA